MENTRTIWDDALTFLHWYLVIVGVMATTLFCIGTKEFGVTVVREMSHDAIMAALEEPYEPKQTAKRAK